MNFWDSCKIFGKFQYRRNAKENEHKKKKKKKTRKKKSECEQMTIYQGEWWASNYHCMFIIENVHEHALQTFTFNQLIFSIY